MRCTTPAALLALLAAASAQTFTSCNPLNSTCPADAALGTTFNETYNADASLSTDFWNITGTPAPSFPSDGSGMAFTISKAYEAPTTNTLFYVLGGHVEVIMQASPGQGIISSIVLLSDDLDEIDWEIVGSNGTHIETNYFGKGNRSETNAIYYPCDGPETSFHNYTINWSADQLDWILDGVVVRSLQAADAVMPDGQTMFPQTPMQLKLGNWAAGGPGNAPGTVAWAGGETDFSKAPFTMMVQQIRMTDGTANASSYTYGDHSGTWDSIKVAVGTSDAASKINAAPAPSLTDRWSGLSRNAKIAIIAGVAGGALILTALLCCCCCMRGRRYRRGGENGEKVWDKQQVELLEYNRMMGNGGFSAAPHPVWNEQYGAHPDSLNYNNNGGMYEKQGLTARVSPVA